MAAPIPWQDQVEHVCATAGVHSVDLLFDQAAWHTDLIGALEQIRPAIPWFSLFTGTPEEHMLDQAPLLMRLDLTHWRHKAWLEELLTHGAADARVLVVISPLAFETLSHALRALSQIRWGGKAGLLRYYDPRSFPLLMSSIFTDQQRTEFRQLAFFWGWFDRDEQMQWLKGHALGGKSAVHVSPFLELSDEQFELMGCISDAQELMNSGEFYQALGGREQRFSLFYSLALKASRENYFGDFHEYVRSRL
jgi:hypothetical protein